MRVTSSSAILAGLIWSLGAVPVLAHGGGLDANGCHRQRSTGDYHCHGAPAPRIQQVQPLSSDGSAFANCDSARASGYSNIRRGEDGYGSHLDRDNDGIACES